MSAQTTLFERESSPAMNKITPKSRVGSNVLALPFADALTPTSFDLPIGLTAEQWLEVGTALGRARGSTMWWIGDWWAYGEHAYGERLGAIKADDWEGPPFQTCVNAGVVCRRFQSNSRELLVSYRAHQAIAPIPDEEWRMKVLEWAAEKRPKFAEIEARVREVKAQLSQGWNADQLDRKARALEGQCVVANMREEDGRQIDAALLAWADAEDLFVRIDRKTDWGNPFEIPDDGEREEVVGKFSKFYLPHKDGLLSRMKTLRGKVLGCWCHPAECHGHIIAEIVNDESAGKGTAEQLADALAEVDG
jgi:hypothetical protein